MSRDYNPPKPTGSSAESRFHQASHEGIHGPSRRIRGSSTVKVSATTKGIFLRAKPGRGGPATASTLNYRGTYAATATYEKGDIVRVMTGNSQGVWISVNEASMTNVPPVFPEPASTVTVPPSVNKWEIFALGIQMTNVCQNGNKVVYINATAPA